MSAAAIHERDIAALLAWLDTGRHRRFAWRRGRDCVSFANGAVEAQTGVDLLAGIGPWSTRREAIQIAASVGGLEAMLDRHMDQVPPALAQRGDVAGLADRRFGIRLMIVEGRTLAGPGTRGLVRLPREAMTMAWSAATARAEPRA